MVFRFLSSVVIAALLSRETLGQKESETLAVCIAGETRWQTQRPIVHMSILWNLIKPFPAADVFASLSVNSEENATEILRVLVDVWKARSFELHKPSVISWAPTCEIVHNSPLPMEPQNFVKMWLGVESCFNLILSMEAIEKRQYDWVLRTRPDIIWFSPVVGLGEFDKQKVTSFSEFSDCTFLSSRRHAELAFKGVLQQYHACADGSFEIIGLDGESHFRNVISNLHVNKQQAMLPSKNVDHQRAHFYCTRADRFGMSEDLCNRVLYTWRQEQATRSSAPLESDPECTVKPQPFLLRPRKVLVATPLKNAVPFLDRYAVALNGLSYPKQFLTVAFLVSDSTDGTAELARKLSHTRLKQFGRVHVVEKSFKYAAPADRHDLLVQAERRSVLARSRNELLKHTLADDIFAVLWLDVDVVVYPSSLIQDLLSVGRPVVAPHVVLGSSTYDRNSWRENMPLEAFGEMGLEVVFEGYETDADMRKARGARDHMDALRVIAKAQGVKNVLFAQRIHGVGTAALLVDANVHRDGIDFPSTPYKHRLESEGFGLLVGDRGYPPCGLPLYEVGHYNEWAAARLLQTVNATNTSVMLSSTLLPTESTTPAATESTTTSTLLPTESPTSAVTKSPTSAATTEAIQDTITHVEAVLELNDIMAFNVQAYADKMQAVAGAKQATVHNVHYDIEVQYAMDDRSSKQQITTAISAAHDVMEAQVNVTVTSRPAATGRRLAVDVKASITTDTAEVAERIHRQAADTTLLSNALASVGVQSTVSITQQPKAKVVVVLSMATDAGVAYEAPTDATLQQVGADLGVTSIAVTSVKVVGTTISTSTVSMIVEVSRASVSFQSQVLPMLGAIISACSLLL